MARVFAQHATAGKYHLETAFVDSQWEWKVIAIKRDLPEKGDLPEYGGTARSLEGAKKSAMACIGLMETDWTNIGPLIELPD